MIDLDVLRNDPERVRQAITAKGLDNADAVDALRSLDEKRRNTITELQQAQEEANESSSLIGQLMAKGEKEKAQEHIQKSSQLKETIKEMEEVVRDLETEQQELLLEIPNLPHKSVPIGSTEEDNEVVAEWGEKPEFTFEPEPHWTLAEQHGLVDFERGAKVTGSGFPFYTGKGARLQRGLIHFFLDRAASNDYTEIQPPLLVNADSARGTGQLPDKEDLMYEVERDDLFLIPTSEVPLTNLYRDEILDADDLPLKLCAYTPCFRREAGSHGKDVRGLNRLHQFDKVELVQFVHPDESYDALESMRSQAESLLEELGIPYRRLLMCTGDMGFTQAKKYDLEVWSAGQDRWLEVSSISNFEAYQARRAAVRYRPDEGKKPQPLHTLNGSGLALPRVVAALLEQYQQEDGTIELPDVLHPYTGFATIGDR